MRTPLSLSVYEKLKAFLADTQTNDPVDTVHAALGDPCPKDHHTRALLMTQLAQILESAAVRLRWAAMHEENQAAAKQHRPRAPGER